MTGQEFKMAVMDIIVSEDIPSAVAVSALLELVRKWFAIRDDYCIKLQENCQYIPNACVCVK